jgi:hypothetical protein
MDATEKLDPKAVSKLARARAVWPFQRFPEWKYEIWNLVTLCKPCHDAFHKAAGGHVRMAIGPFFSDADAVKEPHTLAPYGMAA